MAETPKGGQPNRNNNRNRQGGNRNRNNGGNRNHGGNRNRQGNRKQGGGNRQGGNKKPQPLTFWQKFLSIFGIKPKQQTAKKKPQSKNTKDKKAHNPRQPQRVEVTTSRLYIGNLSYEATEYDIEDLFKGVGPVKGVEIIYNRHTHKSKGYGFVEMQNVDDAKRVVEVLHDQPFMGRKLIVNGAKGKRDNDKSEASSAA